MPLSLTIVSGGQTGADRAALDFAIRAGLPHDGWCPLGRLAEDGTLDGRYLLRESPTAQYAERTAWNVRDSDATALFTLKSELSGGTRLTGEVAASLGKPALHLSAAECGPLEAATRLKQFLAEYKVQRLNVAGPRASQEPEIGAFVDAVLGAALGAVSRAAKDRSMLRSLTIVVGALESFDHDATIYAAKPWTEMSAAFVDLEPPRGERPEAAVINELDYFLEIVIAQEFLLGWEATLERRPTAAERCQRLIEYATNDA